MTVPRGDESSSLADLARGFADPPKAFSPVPIWWWSGDALTRERLRWQMQQLVAGGVYNVVILNLAPTGPLYGSDPDRPAFLSDAWWSLFEGVCEDAEAIGMRLWFYDQIGFSGANVQADLVRKNGAFSGEALETLTTEGEGALELTCPSEGRPLAAFYTSTDDEAEVPVRVPLEERVARTEGPGHLRLVYSITRGFDYFSPEACGSLLDTVHGAFERRLGRFFGRVIVGSFQDELPDLPTWSTGFAEAFRRRKGYDLLEKLFALWEGPDDAAQTVRADFQVVRAALAEEAFFKPLFAWHERHGLTCGFDQQGPARSGQPLGSVQLYADYLRTHRWFGAPGSDHHGNSKIHSSLAHLYGRERVWIEAFHSSGWGGTLEETFDWLLPWLGAGATLYDPHAVYYSTWGGWWEWAPPSTCWRQPYWRHYPVFAAAVSRLCYLLSQGEHVCDIGVLHPTTTVQANLTAYGSPLAAHPLSEEALVHYGRVARPATNRTETANDIYEALVGSMMFLAPKPGVLEQDRRDFDVLDDASVQRGEVVNGCLEIGAERFSVVALPACTTLEAPTAEKLIAFVEGGGTLIAVGCAPQLVLGDGVLLDELKALFEGGKARLVARVEDLPGVLGGLERRVDAPVPTLHRRVGDTEVVYVPAAFPHASRTEDADATWLKTNYSFDPARYARTLTVSVKGFNGQPELWDPLTGERIPLASTRRGDRAEVTVPFDRSPAALLVWSDAAERSPVQPETRETVLQTLPQVWDFTLEPTLDNRYGDLDKPDYEGAPPVQTWTFAHRLETARTETFDGTVHATFGRYGWWTGPHAEAELPEPALDVKGPLAEGWHEASYSLQRGIYKDPLHVPTLGPKGHVPEEFLAFGKVGAGEGVQYRTVIHAPETQTLHLALGAAARKTVWLNGSPVGEDRGGYLWLEPVTLTAGANLLEFRLLAEAETNLRATFAFVTDPDAFTRPERITIPGAPQKDSRVAFTLDFDVPFAPERLTVQVAADATCAVALNGRELGRQGGFDPYYSLARVQPYTTRQVQEGQNTLTVEVQDSGRPLSVLVDGIVDANDGQTLSFISGAQWAVRRDEGAAQPAALARQPWLDPAWSHLSRRPPPLPGTMWLEDRPADATVVATVPDAQAGAVVPELFRWTLPVGATRMTVSVAGEARVWVDGAELKAEGATYALPPAEGARTAVVRVLPDAGRTGGGVFEGPVTYEVGPGKVALGAWAEQGLETYAGGVRYGTTFVLDGLPDGSLTLDLGRVRGTAEVWLNGKEVGVRILAPYRFDLGGATSGENRLEVLVLNTLAPYLNAVSPTHYVRPGQELSGLFGPVRLLTTEASPTHIQEQPQNPQRNPS
jgi:hypothetical protein